MSRTEMQSIVLSSALRTGPTGPSGPRKDTFGPTGPSGPRKDT